MRIAQRAALALTQTIYRADVTPDARCRHAYCRHYAARELESSGQPLEADRVFSENRLVRCRL